MAKYTKREMPDMNGQGNGQAYYQMEIVRNVGYREFIERCTRFGGFQGSVLVGAVSHVCSELALTLADGYSVTIDGLGTFTPKVGVRSDMEQDTFQEGDTRRNAHTLQVSGINFRPDKRLVSEVDDNCILERGEDRRLKPSSYSAEERVELARQFLQKHPIMRTANYANLTGLSYTSASRELCRLCKDPASGIIARGTKSAKLYMLAEM